FVPSVFGATAASVAVKLLCGLPLPRPIDLDAPRPKRPTRDQPAVTPGTNSSPS
ncbi:MAG: hypothetical protein H0T42_08120, partial [Deltaproteobacteria bacterium]|nr:hypothetical protein [Deltaproteobacteria bacterium]